eukprot:4291582-Pyramimonas_sp.AAC.1
MGWSWSFFFAQLAHSTEVGRALELPPGCILLDRAPAPPLRASSVLALPYCDNLTVAATCPDRANRARERVAEH